MCNRAALLLAATAFWLSSPLLAAINLVRLPSTLHTDAGSQGNITPEHEFERSFDGLMETSYQRTVSIPEGANGGHSADVVSEHHFTRPFPVQLLRYNLQAHGAAASQYIVGAEASVKVEVEQDGTWKTIDERHGPEERGPDSGSSTVETGEQTRGPLGLATGVRATAHGFGNASGNQGSVDASANIYEIQAFLPEQYVEKRLRVSGAMQIQATTIFASLEDENRGNWEYLQVTHEDDALETRSLLRFELPKLAHPSFAAIGGANVTLSRAPALGDDGTLSLYRLEQPWQEGNGTTGATWLLRDASPVSDWAAAGAIGAGTSVSATAELEPGNDSAVFDVTKDVLEWFGSGGNTGNYGWALRLEDSTPVHGVRFFADDDPTARLRPQLLLDVILSTAPLDGDADLDGKVDLNDFGLLKQSFGAFNPSYPATWNEGDFNGDGLVDLADFGRLKDNFGKGPTSVVPELSTVLLLAVGAICCLGAKARGSEPQREGGGRQGPCGRTEPRNMVN